MQKELSLLWKHTGARVRMSTFTLCYRTMTVYGVLVWIYLGIFGKRLFIVLDARKSNRLKVRKMWLPIAPNTLLSGFQITASMERNTSGQKVLDKIWNPELKWW